MTKTETKRRPRHIYSDNEKAAALVAVEANGGNVAKTARDLSIPRPTLISWLNGDGVSEAVSDIRHGKKDELAERLMNILFEMTDVIPGKIKDADLRSLITGVGVFTEKYQLLTGGATENLNVRSMTLTELMKVSMDAGDGG